MVRKFVTAFLCLVIVVGVAAGFFSYFSNKGAEIPRQLCDESVVGKKFDFVGFTQHATDLGIALGVNFKPGAEGLGSAILWIGGRSWKEDPERKRAGAIILNKMAENYTGRATVGVESLFTYHFCNIDIANGTVAGKSLTSWNSLAH